MEDDFLRSMSVVPYLEDLHNSSPDEVTPEPLSYNEESFSAGKKVMGMCQLGLEGRNSKVRLCSYTSGLFKTSVISDV